MSNHDQILPGSVVGMSLVEAEAFLKNNRITYCVIRRDGKIVSPMTLCTFQFYLEVVNQHVVAAYSQYDK
jgi:hypothetical protein